MDADRLVPVEDLSPDAFRAEEQRFRMGHSLCGVVFKALHECDSADQAAVLRTMDDYAAALSKEHQSTAWSGVL
jgi:hypothetical protein